MDDTKSAYLASLIFFFGLSLTLVGHALELEYVSPLKQKELESEFARADFSNGALVKNKEWTCDMYGVRSRLQVKRGIKLYQWSDRESWHNDGSQVVSEYRLQGRMLTGISKKGIEDQVKLTANGRLISRLSVTQPNPVVIAYSICSTP